MGRQAGGVPQPCRRSSDRLIERMCMNRFLENPFPNRPANSLRCSPVTAVRPVLYSNLQSDHTKFLYFVSFCFFRGRTAVSCSSSIDRLQLVCFVKGNSLFPLTILSAKLNQLDHSCLRRAAGFHSYEQEKQIKKCPRHRLHGIRGESKQAAAVPPFFTQRHASGPFCSG